MSCGKYNDLGPADFPPRDEGLAANLGEKLPGDVTDSGPPVGERPTIT